MMCFSHLKQIEHLYMFAFLKKTQQEENKTNKHQPLPPTRLMVQIPLSIDQTKLRSNMPESSRTGAKMGRLRPRYL